MGKQPILVVGAGISGLVIANVLSENGYKVTLIDQRDHIGGNTYDYVNIHGIRVHKYGPHIFHTNNKLVFDYLSRFTEWIEYKHRVVSRLSDGTLVAFPPTKTYVENKGLEYIKKVFYEPYTRKMWAMDMAEIDDSVLNRVPTRADDGDLYFPNDEFQFLPKNGYTHLCENMISNDNINVFLGTRFEKYMEKDYNHVFNSMPIDMYYDYRFGNLQYRSIKFVHLDFMIDRLSTHPVINFTDDSEYTRMVEWKNFPCHGNDNTVTSVTYEIPCDYAENNMERYYPVKDLSGKNRKIYKEYRDLPNNKVTFIGRCGMYVYIDIDQAVASSMNTVKKFMRT